MSDVKNMNRKVTLFVLSLALTCIPIVGLVGMMYNAASKLVVNDVKDASSIIIGNQDDPMHQWYTKQVRETYYVQDTRTGLCFATLHIENPNAVFTNVPCSADVLKLVKGE